LKRLGILIFGAKEAIYKCLSVFADVRISLRDRAIQWEHEIGAFAMNVPATARIFAREQRIVALVGTAITLPPGAGAGRE
jgi:hypothetical protein